jgi:hypothetical protein
MKTIAKLTVVVLLGLILAYCQLWPRLIWHPIDRFTFANGPNKSMIPAIFALGEDRETAVGRLTQAGYDHAAIEPFDADDIILSCGDSLCERRREGYTDFFRKSVPPVSPMNLVCSVDYVVWLAFDIEGGLQKAKNELYEQCL